MKNIVVLVSLAVLLMACKEAPSDRDLKEVFTKAVGPHPAGLIENHGASIEIVAVKNTQCEQVSVEKYQCTFNITSKSPLVSNLTKSVEESKTTSALFTERDGEWIIVQQ